MKDPSERTKVVVRRLPPAMTQAALMEQIDARFAGRYKWATFRPGKSSQKDQRFSRAYIDFNRPEDVVVFAEFFDGHVFVNEKGTQFKALVEYAPSQRVPKAWSKKDGREGTILKDPEYLEFLHILAKPVEHLPSAEIQLERKEAERAAGAKETLIVTPLMDFVRQKRAAKSGSQRSSTSGKLSRRLGGASPSRSSASSKRASEKRRLQASMYVLRDSTKNGSGKDKGAYILVARREELQPHEKSVAVASASVTEALEEETVTVSNGTISITGGVETGKRKVVLLKGRKREDSNQSLTTSSRNSSGSTGSKQNQGHDASGRIIRSILLNKDARQNQSYLAGSTSERQTQLMNLERDKRPPRPPGTRSNHISSISSLASVSDSDGKRSPEEKSAVSDQHGAISINEKHDRRTRNKDRTDRVWTPLRRSDGSHSSDDTSQSSFVSEQLLLNSLEAVSSSQQVAGVKVGDDDAGVHISLVGRGTNSPAVNDMPSSHGDMKADTYNTNRATETKSLGAGRPNLGYTENGSHRHVGRRGPPHGSKEFDGAQNFSEGKPSRRGGPTCYVSHERQIWVQKSGSGP